MLNVIVPKRRLSIRLLLCVGRTLVAGFQVVNAIAPAQAQASSQEPNQEPSRVNESDAAFYLEQVKPILKQHCFECHSDDPEQLRGSFALTSKAAIVRGGDSGSAVDFEEPHESVLIQAINYDTYEMPPAGKLDQADIDVLTKWVVKQLPFAPGEEAELVPESHSKVPQVNDESKSWWAFQPPQRTEPPAVQLTQWPSNEIDNFVLANLESVSMQPPPPATKQQLVRRAYYDLTGLPPTPAQVEAFVGDTDPLAYEKLIDSLLASPHYGEKWGRHWLDLVRYAESNSFERDGAKPFVWRYRDYVIRSFNEDKPYDQFLVEQLAGDEIENPTQETIVATGYYRLGQWDDEPADPLQAKYDDLDDIIATTTQTMLGLTVNCARCHDHKIDPIPQKDYYSLVSFFENIQRYGVRSEESVSLASIRALPSEASEAEKSRYQDSTTRLEKRIGEIEAIVKPDFQSVEHEDFQYEMNRFRILKKRVGSLLTKKQFNEYKRKTGELSKLIAKPPGSIQVLCVKEDGPDAPDSFVRIRGNAAVKGDPVQPAFVSVLSPPSPVVAKPGHGQTSGRRLALANWIASPDNPMTARVMANRIWQYHFGRGIVRSTSDFGFQGTPPTHPKLLDWLATEFVKRGWSMKAMHRLIMTSSAYRMSSQLNSAAYEVDPANDRYWRFDLRRLTAEEIRDSILAVNGQLNSEKMFGPSVFTIQPARSLSGPVRPGQRLGQFFGRRPAPPQYLCAC